MPLKFRLKGMAETFIDEIVCPCCGQKTQDDQLFSTELSKVTYDGIVVIAQCKQCAEIFVPPYQRFGVVDVSALRAAVQRDAVDTGEPLVQGMQEVRLIAEKLNAERKGSVQ